MDFPIEIDFRPEKIQIHKDLTIATRKALLERGLADGEKMPSAREMAVQLGVSRTTMVKVYQQLIAEGYLETRIGSGTFVRNNHCVEKRFGAEVGTTDGAPLLRFCPQLSGLGNRIAHVNPDNEIAAEPLPADFARGAFDVLPTRQWQQSISRAARRRRSWEDCGTFGYRPLQSCLANFLRRVKAVNCVSEQVALFASWQQAINFVSSLCIKENDLVAVETPGHTAARNNALLAKARIEEIGVDGQGLKVEELSGVEEPIKLLYVSPSHHDPSGVIWNSSKRAALLQWAADTDALIVEDGRDSDYIYGKGTLPALQGIDQDGRVIYMYDFSKSLAPYVNIALVVIPHAMLEVAKKALQIFGTIPPSIEQFALTDFIEKGELQRHLRRTRTIYQTRRQAMLYNLTRQFGNKVTICGQSAGLHQIVRLDLPASELEILACARQAELPMVAMKDCYGSYGKSYEFLIPFGLLDADELPGQIAKFKELIECAAKPFEQQPTFAVPTANHQLGTFTFST
jgi:GntR family transcriptional regulator/MocR family aminotransferase